LPGGEDLVQQENDRWMLALHCHNITQYIVTTTVVGYRFKALNSIAFLTSHLTATGRHLPYGITQCYLPPDTRNVPHLNPRQKGPYSICLH